MRPESDERLIQEHLFGMEVALEARTAISGKSAIQVIGIIYMPQSDGSVAILGIDGHDLTVHRGSALPDGGRVAAVEARRVLVAHEGRLESYALDIAAADSNARFATLPFLGTYAREANDADIASHQTALSSQAISTPDSSSYVAAAPPRLVAPHFKPLRELRDNHATQRFETVKPPGS